MLVQILGLLVRIDSLQGPDHEPVFVVTGTKHAVMLAKSAIEDKVNGAMHRHHGPHQHKEKKYVY